MKVNTWAFRNWQTISIAPLKPLKPETVDILKAVVEPAAIVPLVALIVEPALEPLEKPLVLPGNPVAVQVPLTGTALFGARKAGASRLVLAMAMPVS